MDALNCISHLAKKIIALMKIYYFHSLYGAYEQKADS